ncbi:MAG: hypothetical protein AAFY59_07375 [Pseudomonadota bacterium]
MYVEGRRRVQREYKFNYKLKSQDDVFRWQGTGPYDASLTIGQMEGHSEEPGTKNVTKVSMVLWDFTGEAEYCCQIGFTKREVADLFVKTFGTSTLNTAIKELTAARHRAAPPKLKSRGMKYGI